MIIKNTLANIIILLEIAAREFLRGTTDIRHQLRIMNEATDLTRTYSSGLTESRNFLVERNTSEQSEGIIKPHQLPEIPLHITGSMITFERLVAGSLFRHRDVSTTMVYTHVLNRGGRGVRSPADSLGAGLDGHFADYNIRK
jgi:hypothetical protein